MPNCLKCGAVVETLGNCPKCPPTATRPPQVRPLLGEELKRAGRAPPVLSRSSFPRTPPAVAQPEGAAAIGVRASTVPRVAPSSILQSPAGAPNPSKSVAPSPLPVSRAVPQAVPDPLDQDPAEVLFRVPEATVPETRAVVREVRARPAGILRRLLAWLVDATLVLAIVAAYLRAATAILGARTVASELKGLDHYVAVIRAWQSILIPGLILSVVLALAYAAAFAVLRAGATPGRTLLRIQLIDRSGSSPSPARTIFRAALSCISFASCLGGIWLALFDRRGQTLHDRLTSTFVVRLR